MVQAIIWQTSYLQLIDQTKLPGNNTVIKVDTIEGVFEAIQKLKVRGAPAIGVAAAYGLYLGMRNFKGETTSAFYETLNQHIEYLSASRPTAVNLFWALKNLKYRLKKINSPQIDKLKFSLLELAIELHDDDRKRCNGIAENGQEIVPANARILTHCNAGALATGGIGTALGVVYRAHESGKNIKVFADETRPMLQGARLTVWELAKENIPVTLICDNMSAALMQQKKIDLVILGADRIAADGSVANKIGTYSLGVLANFHQIPFYVAAPLSTFDMEINRGRDIPIEMRHNDEIRYITNKCLISLPNIDCWNPAFDVTPPELISGIITEKGIIYPPFKENIQKVLIHN